MKLIYCKSCGDVFKLTSREQRSCRCNRSAGIYEDDKWTVTVGGPCHVIGIANQDLGPMSGLDHRLDRDEQNQAIRCWVIAEIESGRVRRIR